MFGNNGKNIASIVAVGTLAGCAGLPSSPADVAGAVKEKGSVNAAVAQFQEDYKLLLTGWAKEGEITLDNYRTLRNFLDSIKLNETVSKRAQEVGLLTDLQGLDAYCRTEFNAGGYEMSLGAELHQLVNNELQKNSLGFSQRTRQDLVPLDEEAAKKGDLSSVFGEFEEGGKDTENIVQVLEIDRSSKVVKAGYVALKEGKDPSDPKKTVKLTAYALDGTLWDRVQGGYQGASCPSDIGKYWVVLPTRFVTQTLIPYLRQVTEADPDDRDMEFAVRAGEGKESLVNPVFYDGNLDNENMTSKMAVQLRLRKTSVGFRSGKGAGREGQYNTAQEAYKPKPAKKAASKKP